jgi:protein SCO1/2
MTSIQKTVFVLIACVAVVLGLTVNKVLTAKGEGDPAALLDAGIVMLQAPRQLPALELVNEQGQPQRLDRLQGKWTLVFFGYTFCPDICPTTLAELRQLQGMLSAAERERLRVVMVSVDPHRDTPAQLKQYLGYFEAGFNGLTGTPEQILQAANALGVPFIPGDTSRENYTVDHGGNLALIDPDGTQRGFIRAPLRVERLAQQLPGLLARP